VYKKIGEAIDNILLWYIYWYENNNNWE
jgi:hypothetical protein